MTLKKLLLTLPILFSTAVFAQTTSPTESAPTNPDKNPVFFPKKIEVQAICANADDMHKTLEESGYVGLVYSTSEMDKTKMELFVYNAKIKNFVVLEYDASKSQMCMIVSGVNMIIPLDKAEKFYNEMTHAKTAEAK